MLRLLVLCALGISAAGQEFCAGTTAGQTCAAAATCIADGNGDCAIPTEFVSIAAWAFDGLESLTSVTIHSGVTSIGVFAFRGTRLTSVVLPDNLAEVPEEAFSEVTTLSSVTFGSGITTINKKAFRSTGLTSLELPDSITELGQYAFENCHELAFLTIGEGIDTIPVRAFSTQATSSHAGLAITVPGTVTLIDDYAFYKSGAVSVTIGNGVETIDWQAFSSMKNLEEIVIPGSVRMLKYGIFEACELLSSVTIQPGVQTIGQYAFRGTGLLGLQSLPESITSLQPDTFDSWVSLCGGASSLGLDVCPCWTPCTSSCEVAAVRERFNNAVSCPGAEDCTAGDGNCGQFCAGTTAGQTCAAAATCIADGNGDCAIPTEFVSIAAWAFDGLESLTSVTIHSGVTSIGVFAFRGTRLTSVVLPDNLAEVPEEAFSEVTTLSSVTFGSGITTINKKAFRSTGLTSLELPDSITELGQYAFENCHELALLTIGEGIDTIPVRAFSTQATSSHAGLAITVPGTVTLIDDYAFYKSGAVSVTIGNGVETIDWQAFSSMKNLEEIVIPGSVRMLKYGIFEACELLSSVTIQPGVQTIGQYAFRGTGLLGLQSLPESITSLQPDTFDSWVSLCGGASSLGLDVCPCWTPCTSSCEVAAVRERFNNAVSCPGAEDCTAGDGNCGQFCAGTTAGQTCAAAATCIADGNGDCAIPTEFVSIAAWAFDGLESLTSVTIHSGVTSIGVFAFRGTRLTSVVLPDNLAEVPEEAFSEVTTLSSVTFGSGITTINKKAFRSTGLTSLELPDSITELGQYAFENCHELAFLTIGEGIDTIPVRAFSTQATSSHAGLAITVPGTVTLIDDYAFYKSGAVSVTIGNGVETIDWQAFSSMKNLEEIVIPGSVRMLKYGIFEACELLSSVTIQPGVQTIGQYAFRGTGLLGLQSLPESITSLQPDTFDSWVSLCGGASSLGLDECPDINCVGFWSSCTAACEVASARSWTETVTQRGEGAACPAATNCQYGENDCVSCNAKLSTADWNVLGYSVAGNQAARTVPGLGTVSCHNTHVAEDLVTGSTTVPTATCVDADGEGDDDFGVTGCVPKGTCLTGGVSCPTETYHRKPTFNTRFGSDEASCCDVNVCSAKENAAAWNALGYSIAGNNAATTAAELGEVSCHSTHLAEDPVTGGITTPAVSCEDADGAGDDDFSLSGCEPKGTCLTGSVSCDSATHLRKINYNTLDGSDIHTCCDAKAMCGQSPTCGTGYHVRGTPTATCTGTVCDFVDDESAEDDAVYAADRDACCAVNACTAKENAAAWNALGYSIAGNNAATTAAELGEVSCHSTHLAEDPVTGGITTPAVSCEDANGAGDDDFSLSGCEPKGTCLTGSVSCDSATHLRKINYNTLDGLDTSECCIALPPVGDRWSIESTVSFDADHQVLTTLQEDRAALDEFSTSFQRSMAAALVSTCSTPVEFCSSISPGMIEVIALRAGSILVDWQLLVPKQWVEASTNTINVLRSTSYTLTVTTSVVSIDASTTSILPPISRVVPMPEPITEPTEVNEIGAVVVVAIVGAVVASVLGTLCFLRRKGKASKLQVGQAQQQQQQQQQKQQQPVLPAPSDVAVPPSVIVATQVYDGDGDGNGDAAGTGEGHDGDQVAQLQRRLRDMEQENQRLRTTTHSTSSTQPNPHMQSELLLQQQIELDRLRLELALLDVDALRGRAYESGIEPSLIDEALSRTEMSPKDSLMGLIVANRARQLNPSSTKGEEKRPPMYVPPTVQGP